MVQKPYLRTTYIEANIEAAIDMKSQYRITNLPDPITIREATSKNYFDKFFNDPSIIKNNGHIDLNDRDITNARFIQVNQLPQTDSHLCAKLYVDNVISDSVDESSLLRLDPDEKLDLDNQDSIILNSALTSPKKIIEIPTKAYIDSLHEENERSRRDLGLDFYDESSTLVRFIQTLQNYLKVSVGNDINNLTKYNKIQLTDTTVMKAGNTGGYLLPNWKFSCNDKNSSGKITNFIKSTKTNSPTGSSGTTSLPPIGSAFMYIETSSNNHGKMFLSAGKEQILFKLLK